MSNPYTHRNTEIDRDSEVNTSNSQVKAFHSKVYHGRAFYGAFYNWRRVYNLLAPHSPTLSQIWTDSKEVPGCSSKPEIQ